MSEKTNLPILTDRNFRQEVLEHHGYVLVEFVADWCGHCRIASSIMKQLSESYQDKIKFGRVDIDRECKTVLEYGIRNIPTCILFKNGNVVDFLTGLFSREAITAWLEPLLNSDD